MTIDAGRGMKREQVRLEEKWMQSGHSKVGRLNNASPPDLVNGSRE